MPMSKAEGSWICYQVYVIQHLQCTYMYMYHDNVVIHTRMRITGRFKGYFLSVHMVNLFNSHRMKVVSSLAVRSKDFRDD